MTVRAANANPKTTAAAASTRNQGRRRNELGRGHVAGKPPLCCSRSWVRRSCWVYTAVQIVATMLPTAVPSRVPAIEQRAQQRRSERGPGAGDHLDEAQVQAGLRTRVVHLRPVIEYTDARN